MPVNYTDLLIRAYDDALTKLLKGGNVQTEIDYREVGDRVEFVAFRNALNLDGILNALGGNEGNKGTGYTKKRTGYTKYISDGRAFYALFNNDTTTLRIYGQDEINPRSGGWNVHYKDYTVGSQYTHKEWNHFIVWLQDAGQRFTEIKHRKAEVQTIVI
jgi:hypothetical protein